MVEPAEADVVGPAVTADDPHGAAHQVADDPEEPGGGIGPGAPASTRPPAGAQGLDPLALAGHAGLGGLGGVEQVAHRGVARARGRAARARRGPLGPLAVDGRAAGRGRTRRCPRTASSTRPGRGRRRRSTTAWSGGCRRRSRSSRWRWPPASGRRPAGRGASGTASHRTRRTPRRTRTGAGGAASPLDVSWARRRDRRLGQVQERRPLPTVGVAHVVGVGGIERLVPGTSLPRAGHTSMHTPQPVQSSGATPMVRCSPGCSWDRNGLDTTPGRRPGGRRRGPSCGWRRAGTRARSGRSRCTGRHPTPAAGWPGPAARSGPSRSATCRPRAGR